jgi:hypothetical protein
VNRSLASASVVLAALLIAGCANAAAPSVVVPPAVPATASPGGAALPTLIAVVTPKPILVPTAVPVATTAAQPSGELVAEVVVRCRAGAPEIGSDRVRASRDGVTFRVTGVLGWVVSVDHELGGDGFQLEKAETVKTMRLAPGDITIGCAGPGAPASPPGTPVRVEDPDAWYRAYQITDGAASCATGSLDYGDGAQGAHVAPVQQARESLRGLMAGDVVERAGYPADEGRVRVVRGDKVIGSLEFMDDGSGGWLLLGSTTCANLGVAG